MVGYKQAPRVMGIALMTLFFAAAAHAQQCTATSPCAAPPAVVGTPYDVQFYINGGIPPYSNFQIFSGALPPGITMTADSTGVVTFAGTPTSAVGSPFVVVITWMDSQNDPITPGAISITVTGAPGPPAVKVAPEFLSFASELGSTGSTQQSLLVQNTGGGSFAFTASVASGSPWVTVSPTSGTVTAGAPVTLTITASGQGLKLGSNLDTIHFTTPAGTADIPVTLFVTNTGSILGVSASGVEFGTVQGTGSSLTQTVYALEEGDQSSNVNWTASIAPIPGFTNPDFLTLGAQNGGASATTPGAIPLSLNANAATLPPGAYYELLQVTDNNSSNSPQYITAVLNVVAATGNPPPPPPPPVFTPGGLVFITPVGQPVPSQQFTLNVSTPEFQNYATAPSLPLGQTWMTMSPASGATSLKTPATVTVLIKTTGLKRGVYSALAEVGIGSTTYSVNVTLIMTAPGSATATSSLSTVKKPVDKTGRPIEHTFEHADVNVNGCVPSSLVLTETGLANSFNVPAGWPSNVIASLNDDCGDTIGNGSVTASFSNGDAPLTLLAEGATGQYSATWQPQNSATGTIVTLLGTASGLSSAKAQITGSVLANQAPVLSPNQILNNATFAVGGALTPGMVAAAKGANLANSSCPSPNSTCIPGSTPIPTALQGTQLIVGGRLAPLYYVSGDQVNAEIPAELTPNQQFAAVGVVGNQLTLPVQITLVPLAPSVVQFSDGTAIAQHNADFSLVTNTTPAHVNEAVIIYVVGMGATTPSVLSGQAAPSVAPLASANVQPTVTVGNLPAHIYFAGLTPGAVGLYQITLGIPATAPSGSLPIVVTQGTITANTTTIPVVSP